MENTGLNCGADGDHFVRIDAAVRFFTEERFDGVLNRRHARLSSHEHYFVNVGDFERRITHDLFGDGDGTVNKLLRDFLKFCPGDFK